MMEKRNERMKMKMVPKSKGFALGTRSQNYMAKVPTSFNTITLSNHHCSLSFYSHGTSFFLSHFLLKDQNTPFFFYFSSLNSSLYFNFKDYHNNCRKSLFSSRLWMSTHTGQNVQMYIFRAKPKQEYHINPFILFLDLPFSL